MLLELLLIHLLCLWGYCPSFPRGRKMVSVGPLSLGAWFLFSILDPPPPPSACWGRGLVVFDQSLMKNDPLGPGSFPRPLVWPLWVGFSGLLPQAPPPWRRVEEGLAPPA